VIKSDIDATIKSAKENGITVINNNDIKIISESMSKMEKRDIEIAYKQFSGLAQYLEYTSAKKVDSTPKLFKVINDFQNDYGYTKGKYTEYTDSVEQFLLKNEYKVPKKIDSSNLNKVIADMKVLADAAKLAMKDK
jgi:hypothetical protein